MLRGSLDDFSLEDILWLVARAEKTGELFVNRPPGSGRFFFASGKVDHVETDLLRTGPAAPGADARATVEDAAFELLRREQGDFSWNPGVTSQSGTALSLTVDDVLAASEQRAAELARIRQFIPSDQSILAINASPEEGVEEISLTRAQWGLIAHIDGQRTVEGIAAEARMGEFQVLRTLYPLAERRLLEVRSSTPAGAATTGTVTATAPPSQIDLTRTEPASAVFPTSDAT